MNWYKRANPNTCAEWYDTGKGYKARKGQFDWSLQCCGQPENRRKDPYKKNKKNKKNEKNEKDAGTFRTDRWGDPESEQRSGLDSFQEEIDIFDTEHREELSMLKNYAKKGLWDKFNRYIEELKVKGYSQKIINRLMTQSMYKVKL